MLTQAQQTTLKTDITSPANATALGAMITAQDWPGIALFYNALSSPDFWAYRSSVSKMELTQATSQDGTTFTYVGNGFIARAAGEIAAWNDLFSLNGFVNPSLPATRQAFVDIFSGTGNAALNRAHLAATARRKVTRGERLYTTGTGSTGSPAVMGFEGALTYEDVQQAMIHG